MVLMRKFNIYSFIEVADFLIDSTSVWFMLKNTKGGSFEFFFRSSQEIGCKIWDYTNLNMLYSACHYARTELKFAATLVKNRSYVVQVFLRRKENCKVNYSMTIKKIIARC